MQVRSVIDAFNEAISRYTKKTDRPGYPATIFSGWRHSFEKYPALVLFEEELIAAPETQKRTVIIKWLTSNTIKNKNHSFRTYLVDVLCEFFPDEGWEKFDHKFVIFYRHESDQSRSPFLYRGSLQSPEDAFANGMRSLSTSKYIEDYAALVNDSAGVSTSLSVRVADFYSTHLRMDHYGVHESFGFLYQIHYRGNKGVNIDATHKSRDSGYPEKRTKKEINIVDRIPREDIVGYGYMDKTTEQYVEIARNPHYLPAKPYEDVTDKASTLNELFNQTDERSSCSIL